MKNYNASIIINTYNRANDLRRLLPSLSHLEGEPFEVVVVNGPSTDDTAAVLKQYSGQIKVVNCPTRNLSQSRNLGIAAASGDIVVFIDDDALPVDAQWLTRFVTAFRSDATGKLAAVGGPVWQRDSDWLEFNGGITSEYGFQKFGNSLDSQLKLPGDNWYVCTAGGNTAFLRKALLEIGGFDEFFTYYLDESDTCIRMTKAGYQIRYLPDNGIRHYKSAQRIKPENINWDVITRSDSYFSLKNAQDPMARRLAKTIRNAPRKHFFKEINQFYSNGEISFSSWVKILTKWFSGFTAGVTAGIRKPRLLATFDNPAKPFLPYQTSKPAEPLRIALLSQTLPFQPNYGGVGRFIYDLALGLHDRGHEVHLFCKDEQPIRRERLGVTIHGISKTDCEPLSALNDRPVLQKNLSYTVAVAKRFEALYRQGIEFDVVHAPNWDAESAALIRLQVYPLVLEVVTSLAKVINTENLPLNEDMRSSLEVDRWQIANADVVTVPSRGICSSYETLMDVPSDETSQWQVVPLGIVPCSDASVLQHDKGLNRLLFVGRLERRKGIHTLLQVIPELMAEFEDWECHLVGNDEIAIPDGGTFKSNFLATFAGATWLDRVVFHGKVSEEALHHHYRQCDLFVAPSLQESFGLIYHEAMQYQKAVVGCRAGGVPEVVEHGVEGLLVTPDCPKELHDALAKLMCDSSLRSKMGQAGAGRVHKRSNYRTMAAGMEELYRGVIEDFGEERLQKRENIWSKAH